MRALSKLWTLTLLGASLAAGPTPVHAANIFEDAWSVMSDPFGAVRATNNLSNALTKTLFQASQLEGTVYDHTKQTIALLRIAMNEGLTGVAEIEKQVNKDAISFVVRMNCLSGNALNDQLQRGVVQVMEIIRESNPTFEILGKKVGEFRVGKVVIENPNEVYDIAKKALFAHLAATVREDTSGYVILSAYQNLERLAKDTRCRYLDQAFEQRYMDEVADLEISSLPWTTVVKVSP